MAHYTKAIEYFNKSVEIYTKIKGLVSPEAA